MKESTCVYLHCQGKTLLLYRNKKAHDVNHGYYIGVGGKKEKAESLRQCAARETGEETGIFLPLSSYLFRGRIYFHYPKSEDEVISVYSAEVASFNVTACDEGTLEWVPDEKVMTKKMWEGDRIFIRDMMSSPERFFYSLYYDEAGKLLKAVRREAEDE